MNYMKTCVCSLQWALSTKSQYAFYEFFLYMANLTLSTVSDGKRMKTLV